MTLLESRAPTTSEWLEQASSLAPVIREYRDESEQQRHMAMPIFQAIRQTGIFEMLVPRAFGGPQADPTAQLRVIEEISRHDGSAGWNVMIWSGSGLFADYLPEDTARDILSAGQGTVIGGAVNPTGQARPVRGGFEVTGRWSFASGCHYLTWYVAGCVVMDGDRPRMLDTGMPDIRAMFIPAADCEIIDTWHTAGLRGTGSHDFRVDGASVPAERAIPLAMFFSGPTARSSTAYRTPFYDVAAPGIAAVGLGIARDAIESFEELAAHKTPAIATLTLADQHTVQQRVGKAEALLRSARAYLYATLEEVSCAHAAGAPITDRDAAALRLAVAHSAQCAVDAVDLMFDAAGGSSVYATSRLERCFRDAHMVTHHMMAAPGNIEMVGQYLLGGPLQPRR
jgi:alkylation response protein AidB-like acyl-CoA dehydrogenase